MVEFRLFPNSKFKALDVFELRGPNRNPGVTFRGAWVGVGEETDTVFALVESADRAAVDQSAISWQKFGSYSITPVVDVEQF
jgi:hypothetical protein